MTHSKWPLISLPFTRPLSTFPICMSFVLFCDLVSLTGTKQDHGSGAIQWALPFFTGPSTPLCPRHHHTALYVAEHTVNIPDVTSSQAPDILRIRTLNESSQSFTAELWVSWRLNSFLLDSTTHNTADLSESALSLCLIVNSYKPQWPACATEWWPHWEAKNEDEDGLDKARAQTLEGVFCLSIWLTGKVNYFRFLASQYCHHF